MVQLDLGFNSRATIHLRQVRRPVKRCSNDPPCEAGPAGLLVLSFSLHQVRRLIESERDTSEKACFGMVDNLFWLR